MTTVSAAHAGADAIAHARVVNVVRRHHGALIRIARRWTGSMEDAEDVVQRAVEIYLRRVEHVDPSTEFAWLKVVVRNEALAVRRARAEAIPVDADEFADRSSARAESADERLEQRERDQQYLEALTRLKPDERKALLLKAEGLSYKEIGEREGWTYTKVNRAVTEGRRRFRDVFTRIDEGDECERFAPALLSIVEDTAGSTVMAELRPHLRHCATCRATIRELLLSRRHRLLMHVPFIAGLTPARWLGDREPRGTSHLKGALHAAIHRFNGPDVATSVQMASSGGGRGPAVAALLGLCLSGGAGTYCLATGALPDPVRMVTQNVPERDQRHAAKQEPEPEQASGAQSSSAEATTATVRRPVVVATPSPPAAPRTSSSSKSKALERTSTKRSEPRQEFGFEAQAPTTDASAPLSTTPAASASGRPGAQPTGAKAASPPPTSGGEFLP